MTEFAERFDEITVRVSNKAAYTPILTHFRDGVLWDLFLPGATEGFSLIPKCVMLQVVHREIMPVERNERVAKKATIEKTAAVQEPEQTVLAVNVSEEIEEETEVEGPEEAIEAYAELKPSPAIQPQPTAVEIPLTPKFELPPLPEAEAPLEHMFKGVAESMEEQAQAYAAIFEVALRKHMSKAIRRVRDSVSAEVEEIINAQISGNIREKIAIIGLIPAQVRVIQSEYTEFFDLRFYGADDYIPRITKVCRQCSRVFVMTDFISHKVTNAVGALPTFVPVSGTLSSLKAKLDQLIL